MYFIYIKLYVLYSYPLLLFVVFAYIALLTLPVRSGQYRSPILGIAEGTVHIRISKSRSIIFIVVITITIPAIPYWCC